jgi:predicted DCC family thiol-disulfide oxidoreductase YuxK
MTPDEADAQGLAILAYDGHCLMCSAGIQWLMQRDRHHRFRFAALQDPQFQPLLEKASVPVQAADSVILYRKGQFHIYSTAVLEALRQLGGFYRIVTLAYVVPRFIRDAVYRYIARHRTAWFGRSEECYFVPPDQRFQFLSDPARDWSAFEEEE